MEKKADNPEIIKIAIQIAIATVWSEDDDVFYAWSPHLRCLRDGDTEDEAIAMCKEAIEIRLESWIERCTLEDNLLGAGYTAEKDFTSEEFGRIERYRLRSQAISAKEVLAHSNLPGHIQIANISIDDITSNAAVPCV